MVGRIACVLFLLLLALGGGCGPVNADRSPQPAGGEGGTPSEPIAGTEAEADVRAPFPPRIRFEAEAFDFGELDAGENVVHFFPFRNLGEQTLRIEEVRTGCGCTAALVTATEVPPAGHGEIQATFRSQGFQGTVRKPLTVVTNDPERPSVELVLTGRVRSEVWADPPFIHWGAVSPSLPTRSVTLRVHYGRPGGVEVLEARPGSRHVFLSQRSADEKGVTYDVALARDLPPGRLTGTIRIRTTSESLPLLEVPFFAEILGRARLSPQTLSLGRVRPGATAKGALTLRRTGGQKLSVDRVKTTAARLRAKVVGQRAGERYRIEVTYDARGRKRGPIAERITVFVGGKEGEILEVPVVGTIGGILDPDA